MVNFCLKSYNFCLYFILHIFTCPNPYWECGSGSKKLLNTDPDPQHCYLGMHRMRISGVVIISNIFLSEGQICTGILSKRNYVYRFMEGHSDS